MKLLSKLVISALLVGAAFSAAAQVNNERSNVLIVNRSSTPVWYLYSSYNRTDLLTLPNKTGEAPGVIISGGSEFVNFRHSWSNSCNQDVLALGKDGRRWTFSMNVCSTSTYILNE